MVTLVALDKLDVQRFDTPAILKKLTVAAES